MFVAPPCCLQPLASCGLRVVSPCLVVAASKRGAGATAGDSHMTRGQQMVGVVTDLAAPNTHEEWARLDNFISDHYSRRYGLPKYAAPYACVAALVCGGLTVLCVQDRGQTREDVGEVHCALCCGPPYPAVPALLEQGVRQRGPPVLPHCRPAVA